MSIKNKVYFASDFHLGVPNYKASRKREALLVSWLNFIEADAAEIYLLGDIFDFWFEYQHVVPKGYVRLLSCLADLVEGGVLVTVFTGNHDMWMFDYLEKEVGVKIQRSPLQKRFGTKQFYLAHGDGLGPGDLKYKFLKLFFSSKVCQWLFARIHPNLSFGIAHFWSKKSRLANLKKEELFEQKEQEWLYQYALEILKDQHYDYFVFGHRHLPLDLRLGQSASRYINLGEWVSGECHYAVFDGVELTLQKFEG